MRRSTDTLGRQWMMLRLIPRYPRRIDTTTLRSQLKVDGFDVDTRTFQRDLQKLSALFALECDERGKPYSWYWSKDAEGFDLPRMDAHTALTFLLADQHLRPVMPPSTFDHLSPYFKRAQGILAELPRSGLATWANKVRLIPSGLPLLPPPVEMEVLETVYTALLMEQRVEIDHCRRGSDRTKPMEVSPLGLVVKGSIIYLVATAWEYEDVRIWALHRVSEARPLDIPRRVPDGFDLDAYVATGKFGYLVSEDDIDLELLVDRQVANVLQETPLTADQELEEQPDGRWRVTATMPYTMQLRGWVMSYGPLVEVTGPVELRETIVDWVREASQRYESNAAE